MSTPLKTIIMRRVYYAYAVSLVANTMFLKGVAFAILWGLLVTFVSVPSVLANLAALRVVDVVPYLVQAFMHTEVWTMLVCIGIVAMTIAAVRSFVSVRFLVRA